MAEIIASEVITKFNSLVATVLNSSISWGTNVVPTNGLPAWFGGTTAGVTNRPVVTELTSNNNELNAAILRNKFYEHAAKYTQVRNTRVLIYMSGDNGTTSVLSDTTARATVLPSNVLVPTVPAVGSITAGQEASMTALENWLTTLKNNVSTSQNTLLTLTNTVCHSSCHSSCHDSGRARR